MDTYRRDSYSGTLVRRSISLKDRLDLGTDGAVLMLMVDLDVEGN